MTLNVPQNEAISQQKVNCQCEQRSKEGGGGNLFCFMRKEIHLTHFFSRAATNDYLHHGLI